MYALARHEKVVMLNNDGLGLGLEQSWHSRMTYAKQCVVTVEPYIGSDALSMLWLLVNRWLSEFY